MCDEEGVIKTRFVVLLILMGNSAARARHPYGYTQYSRFRGDSDLDDSSSGCECEDMYNVDNVQQWLVASSYKSHEDPAGEGISVNFLRSCRTSSDLEETVYGDQSESQCNVAHHGQNGERTAVCRKHGLELGGVDGTVSCLDVRTMFKAILKGLKPEFSL